VIDVVGTIEFIREHIAALLFSVFFFSLVVWVIRMNSANGPYQNFHLAHLVMNRNGELDRTGFRETILFLVSLYGFVHVVDHNPEIIVPYFFAMTSVWCVTHLLKDKLPSRITMPDRANGIPKP
jgi:hypothetical protein